MRFQGEFETLKMVQQGSKVHCGVECTQGQLLMYLVRKGSLISKMQLSVWLQELCAQLDAYHRWRHRAYQYVNPYTIIISEDNKVKLLDLESQENESILIYMQKNVIRESFGRTEGIRKNKIPADFYSLGKTMQFLIAQANITPSISALESHTFSKIIRRCFEETSKNQYQNIKEIQSQIPKINSKNKSDSGKKHHKNKEQATNKHSTIKKIIVSILVINILAISVVVWEKTNIEEQNIITEDNLEE